MVTTDTRALPRPARNTTALIASVVLLVVLTLPVTTGALALPADAALSPYGPVSASQATDGERADEGEHSDEDLDEGTRERAGAYQPPMFAVGQTAATCDQRSLPRDLPDAVPSCALRLAAWEQPRWPLPRPRPDPLPDQVTAGELPPTRAPPLTAHATI